MIKVAGVFDPAIFADNRISADTRAMIALLMTKPEMGSSEWEWHRLRAAMSHRDCGLMGPKHLKRMFDEAKAAGYMHRSNRQSHARLGKFTGFVYTVGMPEAVRAAVAASQASRA